jgi:epoxyqueuosine reductase
MNLTMLAQQIKQWGRELGFAAVGITQCHSDQALLYWRAWVDANHHGDMHYMARHEAIRADPEALLPGLQRLICVRMNCLPPSQSAQKALPLANHTAAIARYAQGRDYHKVLKTRLKALARRIEQQTGSQNWRCCVDTAPLFEKAYAEQAGLGWIGKHTNLLSRDAGSWFCLGELIVDIPLPVDQPHKTHCGRCRACLDHCPTGALKEPYVLDARLCLAYLTIEYAGVIPEAMRPVLGNRIFGCDDCQMVCPWNRFAQPTREADFYTRQIFDGATLAALFAWNNEQFLEYTQGSALRRLGYQRWSRNLAVALGNATPSAHVVQALQARLQDPDPLVREHIHWAWHQHHGVTSHRHCE